MSVLQVLQTDPTNWQSVLVEMQIDPTDFHVVLTPSRPGADRDSRSVLWVRWEIVQIAGVPHNSCLTSHSNAVGKESPPRKYNLRLDDVQSGNEFEGSADVIGRGRRTPCTRDAWEDS